jgi:hypothetical protein
MTNYPLILNFKELVSGNGFLSDVSGRAHIVMRFEDGAWWMLGVNPGGIAAKGSTQKEAYTAFCRTFSEVIQDISSDSTSFADFQSKVTAFVGQTDEEEDALFNAAREAVRGGADVQTEFQGLKRDTAETQPFCHVNRIVRPEELTPKNNQNFTQKVAA